MVNVANANNGNVWQVHARARFPMQYVKLLQDHHYNLNTEKTDWFKMNSSVSIQ